MYLGFWMKVCHLPMSSLAFRTRPCVLKTLLRGGGICMCLWWIWTVAILHRNTRQFLLNKRDVTPSQFDWKRSATICGHSLVSHVHIHHGHKLKHETRMKIADAIKNVAPNSNVHFLHLNDTIILFVYLAMRVSKKPKWRGTFIRVANRKQILSSNYW